MARVGKDCVESTLQHLLLKRFTVALRNADVDVGVGDDESFGNKWHPKRGDRGITPDIQRADESSGGHSDLLHVRRATLDYAHRRGIGGGTSITVGPKCAP